MNKHGDLNPFSSPMSRDADKVANQRENAILPSNVASSRYGTFLLMGVFVYMIAYSIASTSNLTYIGNFVLFVPGAALQLLLAFSLKPSRRKLILIPLAIVLLSLYVLGNVRSSRHSRWRAELTEKAKHEAVLRHPEGARRQTP